MNKKNELLMKKAREAIINLYSDTSVSQEQALDNMRTLQGEIEDFCSTLQSEIETE